ncbi:MAG: hypothetical protein LBQ24_02640 [Candidatus Peribacteria bacterium]|nr:hypothetical protein [Candidatus Peribacteria bacterium]
MSRAILSKGLLSFIQLVISQFIASLVVSSIQEIAVPAYFLAYSKEYLLDTVIPLIVFHILSKSRFNSF